MDRALATRLNPFPGGGEMAAQMRDHDWSATALGPAEDWPAELAVTVSIALQAATPMVVCWGPDLVILYTSGLKVLQSDVRIDLLVTDVGLPGGMNGRQMADAGRERRPGLKVLFITGYAENAAVGNGHLEPGMAVLTKPFVVETRGVRIREMFGHG